MKTFFIYFARHFSNNRALEKMVALNQEAKSIKNAHIICALVSIGERPRAAHSDRLHKFKTHQRVFFLPSATLAPFVVCKWLHRE